MKDFNSEKYLNEFMRQSLQHYWFIQIYPKKHLRPMRRFDISAGNVLEVEEKFIRFKYYRYFLIPTIMKLHFSKIEEIRRYVIRKNPLTLKDIENLNEKNSIVRRKQAKIAASVKYGLFFLFMAILIVSISISTVYLNLK